MRRRGGNLFEICEEAPAGGTGGACDDDHSLKDPAAGPLPLDAELPRAGQRHARLRPAWFAGLVERPNVLRAVPSGLALLAVGVALAADWKGAREDAPPHTTARVGGEARDAPREAVRPGRTQRKPRAARDHPSAGSRPRPVRDARADGSVASPPAEPPAVAPPLLAPVSQAPVSEVDPEREFGFER